MKRKLYANTKKITTIFCICLGVITALLLILRLSVFKDMALQYEPDSHTTTGRQLSYSFQSTVHFSTPTSKGNFRIEIDAESDCYMSFTVLDPDTRTTLLYTGLLEPGQSVKSASLTEVLPDGVYECVAEISAYSLGNREFLIREEQPITLYIGDAKQPEEQ